LITIISLPICHHMHILLHFLIHISIFERQ
jgi:hypothetical protein